ncbi:MAG: antibiotic biosynthesis monooxygenase [Myxococcales bacterium]|nr:antibiotic biosynthesis monooxygenase [Myxococcales bacterium]
MVGWWMMSLLSGCPTSSAFDGPGLGPDMTALTFYGYTLPSYTISDSATPYAGLDVDLVTVVTHTRLRRGAGRQFDEHLDAIETQLWGQPGFIGFSKRREIGGRERWLLSVWRDEASMTEFVTSGAHLAAMQEADALTEGFRTVSYTLQPWQLPPSWEMAVDELKANGGPRPWK